MTKECPHCGVDRFGLLDLCKLTLNYPDASECRNCGGLVRNSGKSQFLTLLLTALLVGFDFVLLSPFVPEWIVFSSLIALIPVPTMLFAKPIRAEIPQANLPPFIPDPNNDKAITVSGWNEDELRQILADFVEEDISVFAAFRIELEQGLENSFALTFPEDVHPSEFLSLINYLAYPINFDPAGRCITVAGKTTLTSDFDGLPKSIEGAKAILYLPENDEDYDVVYLQTESGASFAKSFDEGVWRRTRDARLSSAARLLAS